MKAGTDELEKLLHLATQKHLLNKEINKLKFQG